MLRPAGTVAGKVKVSPAAGAAKWLETSSENAWPSLALWLANRESVGPGKGADLGGRRIIKKKRAWVAGAGEGPRPGGARARGPPCTPRAGLRVRTSAAA